jgi:hypothetical protein
MQSGSNPSFTALRYDSEAYGRQTRDTMTAVKYIMMGMGFMALLVIGSCSLLTYSAFKVAETAAVGGEDAIDRIEKASEKQITRLRNEQFYREAGEEVQDYRDPYE